MNTIRETHTGTLVVDEPYEIRGIIVGDIVVKAGGSLSHYGMCTKSVTIEEGGEATIHGMVNGDIINVGGTLAIFGLILGTLFERGAKTTVSNAAKVGKRGNHI